MVGVMAEQQNIRVLKFGGSSLACDDGFLAAANLIQEHAEVARVVVVVSARGNSTDQSAALCEHYHASKREAAVVLATGEQLSTGLFAAFLQQQGIGAQSFQGWQLPILTDHGPTGAKVQSVNTSILQHCIAAQIVPVISGFQGINGDGEITTFARGGSDTTAVAVAAALQAEACYIYTDVLGVCTADPRRVPEARVVDQLDYTSMLGMAHMGAGVLSTEAVSTAMAFRVPVWVRHTQQRARGTLVAHVGSSDRTIDGLAHQSKNDCYVFDGDVNVMSILAESGIQPIFMNQYQNKGVYQCMMLLPGGVTSFGPYCNKLGVNYELISGVSMISIMGSFAEMDQGILSKVLCILKDIRVMAFGLSSMKISVIIPDQCLDQALNALHKGLQLSRSSSCIE